MRKTALGTALAAAGVLLAAGCQPNLLPDYSPKMETLRVATFAPRGPYVDLDMDPGGGGALSTVANVVSYGVGEGLRARISQMATPDRLTERMNTVLSEEVGKRFPFQLTTERQADGLLEVQVHDYGIVSYGPTSPAYWRLRADARIVYQPENKIVWKTVEVFETPVRPGVYPVEAAGLSGALNIAALSKVTDEELGQMFDRLAAEASVAIADRMLAESRR